MLLLASVTFIFSLPLYKYNFHTRQWVSGGWVGGGVNVGKYRDRPPLSLPRAPHPQPQTRLLNREGSEADANFQVFSDLK